MNLRSLLGAVVPDCGMFWQIEMFAFHIDIKCSLPSICGSACLVSLAYACSWPASQQCDESGVGPYDDDGDGGSNGWALLVSGQSFPLLLP